MPDLAARLHDVDTGALRVCVASSGLGHVARGIEAWAADLGAALARRNVAVSLCKGGGDVVEAYEKRLWCVQRESRAARCALGLAPRRLSWRIGLGSAYALEQSTFAVSLLRHLRRTQADVLHVQDPLLAVRMQQARRAGLIKTRTILAHGTEESPEFLKGIEFLQHLAPWHAECARAAGIWRKDWTTIPNFIDTNTFRPGRNHELRRELAIPEHAIVILSVAAIKRDHKRIDHLVREFHALRTSAPEAPVWLVVAGGWEAQTDAVVAEGHALLGDRVRFLVRYPRQKMPDLYRAADIFVLASLFEMMPIALIEAEASGLPCVVHAHPNLCWIVGAGALAVDMATSGDLAEAMSSLCGNAAQRRGLAASAREHVVDTFSEPIVVDQILHYYQQITTQPEAAWQEAVA